MYKNFGLSGLSSYKKRKYGNQYVEAKPNVATGKPKPLTTPKNFVVWSVDGAGSQRPDPIKLYTGGPTLPISDAANRYIMQLPGTQATPMFRTTGDPQYSDRTSPIVFIEELRLDFCLEYCVPSVVRVFAFRKNNAGLASDFNFRSAGGEYNFVHMVRSGSAVGNTSALVGVLTDNGSSPLAVARDNAAGLFFSMSKWGAH